MRFYLLVSLLFLRICVHGQSTDTSIARIITNLRNFYELNPIEKCYLHTDKDFYQPGETIFFKAYLTLNNSFSTLSNVIYTDITDVNGNLLHKSMWPAASGVSHGSIFLQDTLPSGIYRIRGYTLWMLNQKHTIGEQYVFVQGKKDQSKSFQAISTGLTANIFPEGGTIVHGVPNRIAFRLSDANKLPVNNATAVLADDAGNEVAKPVLFESGTGLLEFTPDANRKYQLTVTYNQAKKNFSLPPVAFNALNLKVDNISPTKLFVQTNASEEFIKNNPSVYVLLHQNGITVSAQKFNLAEAQNATVINKKNLTRGVLQVVVLNEKTELVSNRWIWVNTVEPSALQLESTALSFQPKGKNELTLIFKGTDTPSLSVSVIPADLPSYNFFNNPTVMSYMMVHSNQNSEPFVFNYRYQSITDDMFKLMDALTITMSPSITGWSQITGGIQPPLSYFFETGISIRGFVKKDREKMEFDSSKIDIIIKSADSSTIFGTSKVDERGAFAVNNLHFQKNADVSGLATSKDKKRRKVEFQLLPSYIDTLSSKTEKTFFNPVYTQQSGTENFIKYYSVPGIGKELNEIVVTGKSRQERYLDSLNKVMTTDNFRNSEFTKMPDTNFNYISFAQMFQQEFFGFRFNSGYDRVAGMDGTASGGMAGNDIISYYLNEVPVDVTELNFINPADVVLIKVNRNANLHLGLMGPGPSVLIYTKNKGIRSKFGLTTSSISGYSIPLQFKNPDYSVDSLKSEDRRTTLLWTPHVTWDGNGRAKLNFYNNSYTKRFKIIVQGIDRRGQLYYIEKIVE